ncbi:ABC transporter permease [Natrarchaeobius sp. A-rgal3]|uniref:ABC transporter permease n=1 Tax=Natrarchaeobius versutus TaxID=1679078 RepID=UPI003510335A
MRNVLPTDRDSRFFESISKAVRDNDRIRPYVVVGLPLAVLVVFFLFPLFEMLRLSLMDGMGGSYTLENYQQVFTSEQYLGVIWNSLWVTVVTTAVVVVLAYAFSYSIIRFSRRTTILLLLLVLPFWTNYIVRMYAWINILQDDGVVNWFQIVFLGTSDPSGYLYGWGAVIIGLVYIWLPLATLPIYASISGVQTDLIEASKDLGAGPIRTFTNVTLPLTSGGLVIGTILVAIPTFGSFITPSILGGTGQMMIGMAVELHYNQGYNWPFAAALGTVLTTLVLIFLGIIVKIFDVGMVSKG